MKNKLSYLSTEETFKVFIKEFPGILMVLDPNTGQILYANDRAVEFYGYEDSVMTQMNIAQINIYSKEDIRIEMENARSMRRNQFEFIHRLSNGLLRKVLVMSFPINVEGYQLLYTIVQPKESKDYLQVVDVKDVIENAEELLLLVRMDPAESPRIVYANDKVFGYCDVKTRGKDYDQINHCLSEEFLAVLKTDYSVEKEIFQYTSRDVVLHLGNQLAKFDAEIMPLRLSGMQHLLIRLKEAYEQSFSSYSLLLFDEKERLLNRQKKGRLVCLELHARRSDTKEIQALLGTLKQNLLDKFSEFEAIKQIVIHQQAFIFFSTISFIDLLNIMHQYLADVLYDMEMLLESAGAFIRIGLSMEGAFNVILFDDLTAVMGTFEQNDINSIHISEKNAQYYRWMSIKNELTNAIHKGEMTLHVQEIIDTRDESLHGLEMLIRWMHPVHGLIYPDEFIPYAESKNIIHEIDYWVFEQTLLLSSQSKFEGIYLHLNLSTNTIKQEEFQSRIEALLVKHGGRRDCIVFEITESSDTALLLSNLLFLKNCGFKLALDDFGVGYSSFNRLKVVRFDWIKIDKSFIDGIEGDLQSVLILSGLIALCKNLEVGIIAEGIEKLAQLTYLIDKQCHLIQGYYFSKPSDLEAYSYSSKALVDFNRGGEPIVLQHKNHENQLSLLGELEEVVNQAPMGIALIDSDYNIVYLNQMAGYIYPELEATYNGDTRNLIKLLSRGADFSSRLLFLLTSSLVSTSAEGLVYEATPRGVRIYRWHIRTYFEGKTEVTRRYSCMFTDVTHTLSKTEESQRMHRVIEELDTMVMITDRVGRMVYINAHMKDVFQLNDIEQNTLNAFSILKSEFSSKSPELTTPMQEILYEVFNQSLTWSGVVKCKGRGEVEFWAQVDIYPYTIEKHQSKEFLFFIKDMTQKIALEEYNRDLHQKLIEQDKMASIGLMASGILHEIKSPLSYIKSNEGLMNEWLRSYSDIRPELKDDINDLLEDHASGLNRIEDILKSMKMFVYHDAHIKRERINLIKVLESILELTRNEYKYYADVTLDYDSYGDYLIYSNFSQLQQVFINLMVNSVYAIKAVTPKRHGKVEIRCVEDTHSVMLYFSDNGIGMDSETLSKVFDTFFTTKPKGVGTGLGLFLVKDIVEVQNGGAITCVSDLGVGTVFTLKFAK